jgi:heme-degrading monooxygenase HmoA
MDARVTIAEVLPGKVDEAIRLTRDALLPVARDRPGYRGLLTLVDRVTGKSMAIALWETEADRQAGEHSGYVREQLARASAVLAGPTTGETFTVQILEAGQGSAAAARVLTTQTKPGDLDEAAAVGREAIRSISRQQPGFHGALVLVDRATCHGYTISLWETAADREGGKQSGYVREQLARVGSFLAGPVTREAFEVSVVYLPTSVARAPTAAGTGGQ